MQLTIRQSAYILASGIFAGHNHRGDVCVRDGDRVHCGQPITAGAPKADPLLIAIEGPAQEGFPYFDRVFGSIL
jgi:hypothetical protein